MWASYLYMLVHGGEGTLRSSLRILTEKLDQIGAGGIW